MKLLFSQPCVNRNPLEIPPIFVKPHCQSQCQRDIRADTNVRRFIRNYDICICMRVPHIEFSFSASLAATLFASSNSSFDSRLRSLDD